MVSAGDTVSVPTGSTWIDHEEAWQVQCNQGRNARKCLINKETTHDSNNCILFVTKFQRRLKVKYHCTCSTRKGNGGGRVSSEVRARFLGPAVVLSCFPGAANSTGGVGMNLVSPFRPAG